MSFEALISSHIRPANYQKELVHPDQDTKDIIKLILEADAQPEVQRDTEAFATMLASDTLIDTCNNIYQSLRTHVIFKEDPRGDQFLKSPARLWSEKQGDCKSFSLFIGSVLKNLGIPYKIRFVSEKQNEDIHHVYVVVPDGSEEIIIDATLTQFNYELPHAYKKDYLISSPRIGTVQTPPSSTGDTLQWLAILGFIAWLVFRKPARS